MSRITPVSAKKRKLEEGMRGKTSRPKKKIRKQQEYHSSSEDEDDQDSGFAPVNLAESEDEGTGANSEAVAVRKPKVNSTTKSVVVTKTPEVEFEGSSAEEEKDDDDTDDGEDDEDDLEAESGDASDSNTASTKSKRKSSKRNDPEAFSTSMSKILSTKLPKSARKDPLLSRSREAAETSSKSANEKLEHQAKAKIRAEKKEDLQRGRIKDVLGLSTGDTGKIAEEEKRLRKIAQRGVVKLFNAVRAAQIRGEQAAKEERKKGTIGVANREEKINEMSKQGFLELISGKKTVSAAEEVS